MSSPAHALVFGASGISGWAIVKEALSYPNTTTFDHVTGLTNRPLSIADARLPDDSRLQLVSGVDLTGSVDSVVIALKEKVKHAEGITHVFFTAFIDPGKGFQALKDVNTKLLKVAIEAVLQVTDRLESVVLQTGGKGYGVEFPDKVAIIPPLKESYPRIPEPEASNIFYYSQHDLLESLSKKASWTFTEVRPDVIVGFVPGTNVMNAAQGLGLYLSLYREIHGKGAKVVFPGNDKSYRCKHTDTFQDILAKMEIHAALHPDTCGGGRSFNIADGAVVTWADKWPGICAYFGLEGVGPESKYEALDVFANKYARKWDDVIAREGLKGGRLEKYQWGFLDFIMGKFSFDRQYDLSRARSVGFEETIDTVKGYTTAFDRMRAAKVIP